MTMMTTLLLQGCRAMTLLLQECQYPLQLTMPTMTTQTQNLISILLTQTRPMTIQAKHPYTALEHN